MKEEDKAVINTRSITGGSASPEALAQSLNDFGVLAEHWETHPTIPHFQQQVF